MTVRPRPSSSSSSSDPGTGALALHLCLLLALSACSGVTPAQQNPWPWNPGVYAFSGSLSWASDTFSGERTERRQVSGEVRVDATGPVGLTTTEGACGAPEPAIARASRRRGTRSFRCGTALVTLVRQRVNVGVSMRVDVYETLRRRGGCLEYEVLPDGGTICARYEFTVESRWVSRAARISSVVLTERWPRLGPA